MEIFAGGMQIVPFGEQPIAGDELPNLEDRLGQLLLYGLLRVFEGKIRAESVVIHDISAGDDHPIAEAEELNLGGRLGLMINGLL